MIGCKSAFKDCLEQSKIFNIFFAISSWAIFHGEFSKLPHSIRFLIFQNIFGMLHKPMIKILGESQIDFFVEILHI